MKSIAFRSSAMDINYLTSDSDEELPSLETLLGKPKSQKPATQRTARKRPITQSDLLLMETQTKVSEPMTSAQVKMTSVKVKEFKHAAVPRTPGRVPRKSREHAVLEVKMNDSSTATGSEGSDDGLSDFVVNDSASESELRLPPRSLRKENESPRRRLRRGLRRASSGSRDEMLNQIEESDFTGHTPNVTKLKDRESLPGDDGHEILGLREIPLSLGEHNSAGIESSPSKNPPQESKQDPTFVTPSISPSKPRRPFSSPFGDELLISESSSANSDMPKRVKATIAEKRAFDAAKRELAISFLKELDETVTGGKISELAQSTGGIQVIWTGKLTKTAGTAVCQPFRMADTTHWRCPRIFLSEKIIEDEYRLFNTVAHEFCHLATWMISKAKEKRHHGATFKWWGNKVTSQFPHKDISVTTTHSYSISYKYIWSCVECDQKYKRQTKSIDPLKHCCGRCKGKLLQSKPALRNATGNGYNEFVSQWYRTVKEQNPGWEMREVMAELSKRWRQGKEKNDKGMLAQESVESRFEALSLQ